MPNSDCDRAPSIDGLVVVDKPAGLTSHDVVSRLRRILRTRRVGHAGTLDPMATGVLVVGVNRATRLLHHLVLADKEYTATIRLGQRTITDDAEGEVVGGASAAGVREQDVLAVLPRLSGPIDQVPAAVSAIKVAGERAYSRVRSGEVVELAARPVVVRRFDALAFSRPTEEWFDVDVIVECSSGTYIRALARDVGDLLGVGGHLTALRRTRVGPFGLADSATLAELAERAQPVTLPLATAIRTAMPTRSITAEQARELSFGRAIAAAGIEGTYGALGPDDQPIALLDETDGAARPILVFAPAG